MKKPSLLDRLTNAVSADDPYDDLFDDEHEPAAPPPPARTIHPTHQGAPEAAGPTGGREERAIHNTPQQPQQPSWEEEPVAEHGELAVDVYQTDDFVVIKALVAGVLPSNLDVALTRDMLTIRGVREDEREAEGDDYFRRELYWGEFSRSIMLPEEVDVDAAEASEKHGILVIRLPKINKARTTKLKVKTR